MASQKSARRGERPKLTKRDLTYFYLGDTLYKILWVNRAANAVWVWNFDEQKRYQFVWSDVKRRADKAFTTPQVGRMIGRHPVNIRQYILAGEIPAPKKDFFDFPGHNKKYSDYRWSPKDIMILHDFLSQKHRGRPRNDGYVRPAPMPTKAELRALMNEDTIFYVKDKKTGEMKPVWREADW